VKLLPRSVGKTKAIVIAKGANLVLPTPSSGTAFFYLAPNLQVQLFNSEGECWSSEFVVAKKNPGKPRVLATHRRFEILVTRFDEHPLAENFTWSLCECPGPPTLCADC
jgi:hypothetical protein